MGQRRMFHLQIVASDAFLDMPTSSRELYFQLGMYADDEGFVNPKKILRMTGASDDDLKVLISKRFILPFESGVVVIKHWLIHNTIRMDRFSPTHYTEEKAQLNLKENKSYTEVATNRQPDGNQMVPQVKLSKVNLSKDNLNNTVFSSEDERLSKLLLELIRENNPTFKEPHLPSWNTHVNKMRRIDKRTPDQIEYLIRWSQSHHFWQANILSTQKLRKQFDTLVAQVRRDKKKVGGKNYDS